MRMYIMSPTFTKCTGAVFLPQVEFTEILRITRVVLYGGGRFSDAYISKFYVMYSNTMEHLRVYADQAGLYKVNPHNLSKR